MMRALVLAFISGTALAQAPAEFAWRGVLELPPNASVVRAALPAEAIMQLQSPQAADVRVFDGRGQPLPFAFAAPLEQAAPAAKWTGAFAALPLYSAQPASARGGAMQIRLQDGATQRSLWVQMDGKPEASDGAQRANSVLFDTRARKDSIDAITVKATLPPNAPVALTLSMSKDLAQWTPVPLQGRVFRFDGEGAPANDTLILHAPIALEGHYLRLDWGGQQGVDVQTIAGRIMPAATAPRQVSAALPAPTNADAKALEWRVGFAAPIAALDLKTQQANTLVPVRILGRRDNAEPWRELARTVVYRIQSPDGVSTNQPVALPRIPVRWLRVEATHGMRLDALALAAHAVFDPLEVLFVAGGSGPYEVAAGRAQTSPAALPVGMISATTTVKPELLPVAKIASQTLTVREAGVLDRWLPQGTDGRTLSLWAVLAVGVAVLALAAWSLLRQLGRREQAATD